MIEVCSLSSGSKGNSYFVRLGKNKIIVDAGISMRQMNLRLSTLGYSISDMDHIFITHEHSDHISGLKTLIKNYKIPVFITKKTYEALNFEIESSLINYIKKNSEIFIDNTMIQIIEKPHDAVEPVFFNFYYKDKKITVLTDFGSITDSIIDSVKDSDILFLETNYDKKMLLNGPYDKFLKKRIESKYGHLSNCDAGFIIENFVNHKLKYLFLSHISEQNNDTTLIMQKFGNIVKKRKDLKDLRINLTFQTKVSEFIRL